MEVMMRIRGASNALRVQLPYFRWAVLATCHTCAAKHYAPNRFNGGLDAQGGFPG